MMCIGVYEGVEEAVEGDEGLGVYVVAEEGGAVGVLGVQERRVDDGEWDGSQIGEFALFTAHFLLDFRIELSYYGILAFFKFQDMS
jgi:hypothetical protein